MNSDIFVKGIEIYKYKEQDSEVNAAPLSLGNVSKEFSVDNMRNTRLYRYVYYF